MNERIRQLALQARLGPALLLHHYGKVDALTDTEQEGLEQIEKFAELIIRKCLLQVAYVRIENDFEPVGDAVLVQVLAGINKHFGVEE